VPADSPTPSSTISTLSGANRTSQRVALLCRTTLVTASRMVHANSSRNFVGTSSAAPGSSASTCAAASASRAAAISPGSEIPRTPMAVARTSDSASRASASRSPNSLRARSTSTSSRRCANSAFTVTTVSEWPRMSCRSDAIRARSFCTARCAISCCATMRLRCRSAANRIPQLASEPSSTARPYPLPSQPGTSRTSSSAPTSSVTAIGIAWFNARPIMALAAMYTRQVSAW
jgi:hypothetical protein